MKRLVVLFVVPAIATLIYGCVPPQGTPFGGGAINPWFPLDVGHSWTYDGIDEGQATTETVVVTGELKTIVTNGNTIAANVVVDEVFRPWLAESTRDFYATANDGTVYYLGEETAEFDSAGQVISTAGSWQAGVDGASGGVFMPADPQTGQQFQQENARDAKDFFAIEWLLFDTMVTREWSPLEPGVVEHKTYERNVGLVQDGGLLLVR